MLVRPATRYAPGLRLPYPGKAFLHAQRETLSDSRWPGWEVVVGIEVHAQIKTRHKLFSGDYKHGNLPHSI